LLVLEQLHCPKVKLAVLLVDPAATLVRFSEHLQRVVFTPLVRFHVAEHLADWLVQGVLFLSSDDPLVWGP
jgi:hypothetical protein